MRRFLALASFSLLALSVIELFSPIAAHAQTIQTGPNGRTYRTFANLAGAEAGCRTPADAVWLMGTTADAKYTRKTDPLAGKSPGGTWACFDDVLLAGFQEQCAAGDPNVWADFQKQTWAVNGSSVYKQGVVAGFICLQVALDVGFTQALAKGTFEYLTPASRVKCVAPDEVVWDSLDTKTIVRLTDLSAGKGRGGYVCRSLAELNGRKLTPTGYANAADANCKPSPADQLVWFFSNTKSVVVPPDPAAGTGSGFYICLGDAVNNAVVNGYKLSIFGANPGDVTCAPPDVIVWGVPSNKTWFTSGSSGYAAGAQYNVILISPQGPQVIVAGRYLCLSDAKSRGWAQGGIAPTPSPGPVFAHGVVPGVLPSTAPTSSPSPLSPPSSLTCFSGDKIEWVLANGNRVAPGAPGAGQGTGAYLCATANGDHPYAGTSGTTLLNGPKAGLLGFSAIPPDSVAYFICKAATKYGDMFSYGAMGQYGWVTDGGPYTLFIHGDSRVGRPPGHYACADDAVAAGWTPKKVNAP